MIKNVDAVIPLLKAHGYTVMEPLGNGGFASCYRIRSEKYEQTFVCKISENKKAFDLELNILSIADHPNIVRCYEYFSDEKFYILILEDCTEGNLYDYIQKNGPLDLEKFNEYCTQLLHAIAFLHKKGVAHLDIKPSNIMLNKYGKIKLGDFGLSRLFNENELCHSYNGTKLYMCPEIIFSKPYNPFKADIWAFGVTAYYFLTGHNIVRSNEEFEILVKTGCFNLADDEYPILFRNILVSCLALEPKNRPSAQVILDLLEVSTQPVNERIIKLIKSTPKIQKPFLQCKERALRRNKSSVVSVMRSRNILPFHKNIQSIL